jgi:hypothetical protein
VSETASFSGAAAAVMSSPTTSADGSFSIALPPSVSSGTLRFSYRVHPGDAAATATSGLTLSVKAGVALSISPRVSGVGRTIRFSGRLLGGPVPRTGKLILLQARSPRGPWIEFNAVRSDSRGAFRARYRFRFPGPANYQFRAVSELEADYPFLAGSSTVVAVHER